MLRKRRGTSSGSGTDTRPFPELTRSPGRYDAVKAEAEHAAEMNDAATVVRLMTSTTDWNEASVIMMAALGDVGPEPPQWVSSLVSASPSDPLTRTVQGTCLVHQAWAVRGSGRASTVSAEQFDDFWTILRRADDVLRATLQDNPVNPIAWGSLMPVCMGLQVSQEEVDEVFHRSHRYCPNNLDIQTAYLQPIVEKWGGSHEKAIAFARWASSQRPDGDPGHLLVAYAHVENVLQDGDEARTAEATWEIRAALERSRLAHPDWGNEPDGLFGKNVFAMAAYGQRDVEVARHLMSQIGLDETRIRGPWGYFGGGDTGGFLRVGRELGLW